MTLLVKGQVRLLPSPLINENNKVMIIVQIGANKGNTDNDPVWRLCQENLPESLEWDITLVEPNPKAISIITKNYKDNGFTNFTVINMGVSDKEEELILYVDNDIPGNEASQHASLDINHMYKMGHTNEAIVEYKIKCVPLSYVLPLSVDYLQIDTEGHDAKIILGADFCNHDVKVVEFEHIHLSVKERHDVHEKLVSSGYEFCWIKSEDTRYELKC